MSYQGNAERLPMQRLNSLTVLPIRTSCVRISKSASACLRLSQGRPAKSDPLEEKLAPSYSIDIMIVSVKMIFCIQKLILLCAVNENYFTYLPDNRLCASWGCTTVSTGHTKIPPHSVYPPIRHPDDHHFDWRRGRILQAYQVILISHGRGLFEFGRRGKSLEVHGGSIVLLFPGVWHRFAPDPDIGWTENWLECRSTAFDFARENGMIDPERPVLASSQDFVAVFDQVHTLASTDALLNQPVLSTLGLQLLALLTQQQEVAAAAPADRLVEKARLLLMERCTQPLSVEDLAGELGVSYSYFRRIFREKTGASPKQHQMTLRIRRAQDILVNTDKSIKEIAGLLGFNSAFHFSGQFQQMVGCSASEYRARYGGS